MNDSQPDPKADKTAKTDNSGVIGLVVFWACMLALISFFGASRIETIPYSSFISHVEKGRIQEISIREREITGSYRDADSQYHGFRTVRVEDPQLLNMLNKYRVGFRGEKEDSFSKSLITWFMPILFFFLFWRLIFGGVAKDGLGPGMGLMSMEKSRARVYMESHIKTTFQDVAGIDEAKEELQQVIDFLKNPKSYTRLGGHLPKGILLVGPPGTGKTLLAKAVAGEANVPFFSISGSEFVELFVGIGAARVRDLFSQAQSNAPCIIFIDELDALGRARGLNPLGGGHDEKEQTLNQLLVEMDGFDPRQGVVLLAATNRPEILDAALLRAGRFDRHILVDRPDKTGRTQILKVHLHNVTYDETVNIEEIASSTPGFTGADLANLVNEAVLTATKRGANAVQAVDFTSALERVVAGLEKKNRILNPKERRVVAFHEMGHALVSMSLPGTERVHKVSIIPRGIGALGYTMQRPTEDRFLMSKEELENKLAVLLGGRAAEMLVFEDMSTGAADDLSKATEIARSMVTRYGMIEKLGPVAYEQEGLAYMPGTIPSPDQHRISEATVREIDCAVRELVNQALDRAINILTEHRDRLDKGAQLLLARETLCSEDLQTLLA